MTKNVEAFCRKCGTLALPVCSCGEVAFKKTNIGLHIYSDDLSSVSLMNTWKDSEGKLVWLEETDVLAKAKLSKIFDIVPIKD